MMNLRYVGFGGMATSRSATNGIIQSMIRIRIRPKGVTFDEKEVMPYAKRSKETLCG